MTGARSRKLTVSLLAALLSAGAVVALISASRDGVGADPQPPDGARHLGAVESLARRLPDSAGFVLATDDMRRLAAELQQGRAGKLIGARSVSKFLVALQAEPPGDVASVFSGLKLGLAIAWQCEGPGALVLWKMSGDRGPALGVLARVGEAKTDRCLKLVARNLCTPGEKPRSLSGKAGEVLLTLAPRGREGSCWGSAGDWIVVADSIAACRELLSLAAKPRSAPSARLARALRAAGSGRLVGFFEAGGLIPGRAAHALGLKRAEWIAYVGRPQSGGRWAERLVLSGEKAPGGLLTGLGSGGKRTLLRSLPASALVALSANVTDGGAFWRELVEVLNRSRVGSMVPFVAVQLGSLAGRDFQKDIAGKVRGEVTVAAVLPHMATVPQVVIGAGHAPESQADFDAFMKTSLEIPWFGRGQVREVKYREAKLKWLADQELANPFAPSPAYCFRKDLLLATTSSARIKELLAGRGGLWLSAEEGKRLSRGRICLRVDLKRALPFVMGELRRYKVLDRLGAGPVKKLPEIEDLQDNLDRLDVTADRCPQGVEFEVDAPLPAAAIAAIVLLVAE